MIHTPVRGRRSCAESAPWPPRRWRRRLHSSRRLRGKPGRAVLQRVPRASAHAHRRCPCRTRWRSRAPRVNSTRLSTARRTTLRSRERGRAQPMSRCRSARSRATSSCSQPTSLRVPCQNGVSISGASFSLRPGHVPARRCSCARTPPSTPMTPGAVQARQAESAARAAAHRFLDEATTAKAAD